MSDVSEPEAQHLSGAGSRMACSIFNYGNIAAVLAPIPLGMLWIGMSIIVYAMNRHHPNSKVGYYTQQAGYRFYGIIGAFVIIASSFPKHSFYYYMASWAIAAAILIPLSIRDLYRIRRDEWPDIVVMENEAGEVL